MENTPKPSMGTQRGTHSFPPIQPESKKPDRSGDCFRPLFQTSTGDPDGPVNGLCDDNKGRGQNDPLAVALKESYERGVDEGNKEACGIAQKELEPSLEAFFGGVTAFSDNVRQLNHNFAIHTLALACAIAGKLAKEIPESSPDEMKSIQVEMDAQLRHHHQLHLLLNIDDLKDLADLMRCRNIEMANADVIQISDNDTVQRGVPQPANPVTSFEAVKNRIIEKLDERP